MEVISLHGTDDRLYELVSRLVMNPEILRQNNNYPFKTSNGHTWYLCMDNGCVSGFMPVLTKGRGLYIDNYYISGDEPEILDLLTEAILASTDKTVTVLSHKRHSGLFRRHGFISGTVFSLYDKLSCLRTKGAVEK